MTLAQLLEQLRIELDDVEEDYLWSDAELTRYLNEAEKEACRRARLIIDSTLPDVTEINVTASTPVCDVDPRIIRILDVIPSWDNRPLRRTTMQEMNLQEPSWRERTDARPQHYIADYGTNQIRIFPIPTVSGLLRLRVYRIPIEEMQLEQKDSIEPEIKPMYHEKLIHWAKHRAYLKKDADTLDKNASAEALAMFEAEFGPAKSAWSEEFDARHLPNDLYDGQY